MEAQGRVLVGFCPRGCSCRAPRYPGRKAVLQEPSPGPGLVDSEGEGRHFLTWKGLSGVTAAEEPSWGGSRGGQTRKTPPCILRSHAHAGALSCVPSWEWLAHPRAGAGTEAHTGRALNKKRGFQDSKTQVCAGVLRGEH